VHGHAHRGSPEGRTSTGIPVYNVALQVLRDSYPDRPTFRMLEVEREVDTAADEEHRAHGRRATDREPTVTRVSEGAPADSR
jgi:hypothetical protein